MIGTIEIVRSAQQGEEKAIRELFNIVKEHHMPRYVGRYRGSNVLVGNDEIESEFLLGFWKALPKAKLDMGNPINFLCWKGQKAVQSLMRNTLRREVRYECYTCHHTGKITSSKKTGILCGSCGASTVSTWMVAHADNADIDIVYDTAAGVSAEQSWQLAVHGLQIEELRGQLSGRVRDLFDKIVLEGIERGASKNYIAEIAESWGVSTAFVAATLRKLRAKVTEYMAA